MRKMMFKLVIIAATLIAMFTTDGVNAYDNTRQTEPLTATATATIKDVNVTRQSDKLQPKVPKQQQQRHLKVPEEINTASFTIQNGINAYGSVCCTCHVVAGAVVCHSCHPCYLMVKGPIDCDTQEFKKKYPEDKVGISMQATSTDVAPICATMKVTLEIEDLNDSSPVFNQTTLYKELVEMSPINDVNLVLRVRATDADKAEIGNGHVTFSSTGIQRLRTKDGKWETVYDPGSYFRIASETGNINVQTRIDREEFSEIVINIIPSDNTRQLKKPEEINTASFTIPDGINAYGSVCCTCHVVAGAVVCHSCHPCYLMVKGPIDCDTQEFKKKYPEDKVGISMQATSTDVAPICATMKVTLEIEDLNDSPPVFNQTTLYKKLVEMSPINDVNLVLRVRATDADKAEIGNGRVTFSSTGIQRLRAKDGKLETVYDPGSYFRITSETGNINVQTRIDREEFSEIVIDIVPSDNTRQREPLMATITATIKDINVTRQSDKLQPKVPKQRQLKVPEEINAASFTIPETNEFGPTPGVAIIAIGITTLCLLLLSVLVLFLYTRMRNKREPLLLESPNAI